MGPGPGSSGLSEDSGRSGCPVSFLGSSLLSLPAVLPVFVGAGGEAGLARDGLVGAGPALSKLPGFPSAFLRQEAAVLPAFGSLVSLPVVLLAVLALGLPCGRSLGFRWIACPGRGCGSGLCRFGSSCSAGLPLVSRVDGHRQCKFPFQGSPYHPLVRTYSLSGVSRVLRHGPGEVGARA